mgnify:CR=1 FL=1
MAFVNAQGENISYNCSDLIEELKDDIEEFGGDMLVEVVTEERKGVTIYKDYNFIANDPETAFTLTPGEKMQRMTATALMLLYEIENNLF